ncbi:hypothetical protein C8J57DRAFT_2538 [Mycena rebaudengoi]|nr:hypothetical protein C8J57DRAFT_2538 [Mycena rebaudengoi]
MSRFICLFSFLAFSAIVTFFALQNRRTLRRRAAQNALSASSFSLVTDRDKPACHDVHFATATERPRWESIQPLAVESPPRRPPKQRGSRWTPKHTPFSLSDASLSSAPVVEQDFDQRLQIAVLILLPAPPEPGITSSAVPWNDIAVGIAEVASPEKYPPPSTDLPQS